MKSKNLFKLIVLLAGGELFINNLTPGALTTEEIILDIALMLTILVFVVNHRRLHILAEKLPFIDEVLDCVEEYCNSDEQIDYPRPKKEVNKEEIYEEIDKQYNKENEKGGA